MKAELRSYSSVVQNSCKEKSVSQAALKNVLQDVVKDEDRSKNVIIFGLEEENDEELNFKVIELFQSMGEKP